METHVGPLNIHASPRECMRLPICASCDLTRAASQDDLRRRNLQIEMAGIFSSSVLYRCERKYCQEVVFVQVHTPEIPCFRLPTYRPYRTNPRASSHDSVLHQSLSGTSLVTGRRGWSPVPICFLSYSKNCVDGHDSNDVPTLKKISAYPKRC